MTVAVRGGLVGLGACLVPVAASAWAGQGTLATGSAAVVALVTASIMIGIPLVVFFAAALAWALGLPRPWLISAAGLGASAAFLLACDFAAPPAGGAATGPGARALIVASAVAAYGLTAVQVTRRASWA